MFTTYINDLLSLPKKKTACYVGDSQICLNCKTSELSDAIHEVNLDLTEFVDGTAKTRCSKSQNRPEFLWYVC